MIILKLKTNSLLDPIFFLLFITASTVILFPFHILINKKSEGVVGKYCKSGYFKCY